jgi:hypothetical protein
MINFEQFINESTEPQIAKIATLTGTRAKAVEEFVSKHALNITKLLKFVQKGSLKDRMDFVSALAGKPGNKKQKQIIKMFNESIVNEKFTHNEKDIIATANGIAKAISKMDNVKAEVHDLEFDKGKGASFEISIDGEKSAGGSYIVKDNGDVVNMAIANKFPNAVYTRIGDIKHRNPIGKVDIKDIIRNIKLYESTLNEGRRVTLKRRYTENHPAITAGKHAKIRNKILEAIGDDGKITQEEFDNILKELSSNGKRWMRNNSKYFNVSEEGISLSKFGRRILQSITINETEPEIDKKPLEMKINEAKEETGLMIKGRTRSDNQKIDNILDDLDLYAEWDAKEGFFFLPEEEDMFDELEMMIQKEFDKRNVNAYFEGVFESLAEAKKNPNKWVPGEFEKDVESLNKITYNEVKKLAKKHKVFLEDAIDYVEYGWDIELKENKTNMETQFIYESFNDFVNTLDEAVNESQLDMFAYNVSPKAKANDVYFEFLRNFAKQMGMKNIGSYSNSQLDNELTSKLKQKFQLKSTKYADLARELVKKGLITINESVITESITKKDIKVGAEFKVGKDTFKVDEIENDKKLGILVKTSRVESTSGKKYEYRDSMEEFVDFLNDEKAKIK